MNRIDDFMKNGNGKHASHYSASDGFSEIPKPEKPQGPPKKPAKDPQTPGAATPKPLPGAEPPKAPKAPQTTTQTPLKPSPAPKPPKIEPHKHAAEEFHKKASAKGYTPEQMSAAVSRVMQKLAAEAPHDPKAVERLQKAHQVRSALGKMPQLASAQTPQNPPQGPMPKPQPASPEAAPASPVQAAPEVQRPQPPSWSETPTADEGGDPPVDPIGKPGIAEVAGTEDLDDPQVIDHARKMWKEKGTESPYFKRWFKQSAVKDEAGKPLKLFHGTGEAFDTFDPDLAKSRTGSNEAGFGFHFGTSDAANKAIEDRVTPEGSQAVPVYLNVQNPLEMRDVFKQHPEGVAKELQRLGIPLSQRTMASLEKPGYETFESLKNDVMAAGYDGVKYANDVEGGTSYIAFNPEQIKSATGNRGTFDADNARIDAMQQPEREQDALGFTSNINDALRTWQGKGTPQQLLAHLAKHAGANAQADAIGLKSWLEGKQSVTREQVADFARGEYPELEEVSQNSHDTQYSVSELPALHGLPRWGVFAPDGTQIATHFNEGEARQRTTGSGGPKFSQYVTPGPSSDYDEIHITAPGQGEKSAPPKAFMVHAYNANGESTGSYSHPTLEKAQEVAGLLEQHGLKAKVEPLGPKDWSDGHSDYAHVKNPVVRVRLNSRQDADGKKVLFIEEMQGPSAENQKKMPEWLRDRIYDIGMKRVLRKAADEGYDRVAWTTGEMQNERYPGSGEGLARLYDRDIPTKAAKLLKKVGGKVGRTGIVATDKLDPSQLVVGKIPNGGGFAVQDARTGKVVSGHGGYPSKDDADKALAGLKKQSQTPVHSIDITPQVKAHVSEGQPLYMQQQPGGQPGEKQNYPPPPQTPKEKQMSAQIMDSASVALQSSDIPPEEHEYYRKNVQQVLSHMTEKGLSRVLKLNPSWVFKRSPKHIMDALASGEFGAKNAQEVKKDMARGVRYGGVIVTTGGKRHIIVDGDTATVNGAEYKAHEIGHLEDYREDGTRHSDTPEWRQIHAAEMADGQVSEYGAKSAMEGWAELRRKLNSGYYDRGVLKAEHPRAFAYMVREGLTADVAPKEGSSEGPEVFDGKTVLNRNGEHADHAVRGQSSPIDNAHKAVTDAAQPHHKAALDLVYKAAQGKPEAESHYRNAASVIGRMTPKASAALSEGMSGIEFADDHAGILPALMAISTPKEQAELKAKYSQPQYQGKPVGGIYAHSFDGDPNKKIVIANGDYEDIPAAQVQAHEFGHAIDGPKYRFSSTPEWQQAYVAEIRNKQANHLSDYAADNPRDAFAEFARLVYGQGASLKDLRQKWPEATAFWEKNGLIPPQKGLFSRPYKPLAEIFDQAINTATSHVDTLKTDAVDPRIDKMLEPRPVEQDRSTAGNRLRHKTTENIDGKEFAFVAHRTGVTSPWEIRFDRTDHSKGGVNPVKVFGFVANSVRQLLKKHPDTEGVTFSASSARPARIKLYQRLAENLAESTGMDLEVEPKYYTDRLTGKPVHARTEYRLTHPYPEVTEFEEGEPEFPGVERVDPMVEPREVREGGENGGMEHLPIHPAARDKFVKTGAATAFRIHDAKYPLPKRSKNTWSDDEEYMPGVSGYANLVNAIADMFGQSESVSGDNYSSQAEAPSIVVMDGKYIDGPGAEVIVPNPKIAAVFTRDDVWAAARETGMDPDDMTEDDLLNGIDDLIAKKLVQRLS